MKKMTDDAVFILDSALRNRRLISFHGIFKEVHKKLNLDDMIDGDLVNTNNDDDLDDKLSFIIERYKWHIGLKQYFKF